jgi:hypothetical protein
MLTDRRGSETLRIECRQVRFCIGKLFAAIAACVDGSRLQNDNRRMRGS